MNWAIYVDVSVGMALAIAVLVVSFVAGREPAIHRTVWIVGIVLLSLRALFSTAIGMGTWLSSGDMWAIALGALALALMVPAAFLRPRWTGIALLASAVLQPLLLVILRPFAGEAEGFPVEVMLGFYSLTVAIIGGVLIASTMGSPRQADEVPTDAAGQSAERVSGS
ncbi:MAG: hypothetical protein RL134_1353 [Actinomycetota bacterium]|jgi:hypothetical protein